MVEHRTKKRHVRQRTKKCPDCGRMTVIDDKWSSCQWCHWPLSVKHPLGIEQGKSALWTLIRTGVVVYLLVIILCGLIALGLNGWKLLVFQQLIMEHWHVLLLVIFGGLVIVVITICVLNYLAARPVVIFVMLVAGGILLLLASQKGNLFSQYISRLVNAGWDINLFSASITVFSLAFTFAAIIMSNGRTKK